MHAQAAAEALPVSGPPESRAIAAGQLVRQATGGVARGTVTNLSSSSLTISNTSCDVKVVFGNTVQVSKNVAGNTSDLKDSITVTITGTRQADGSIKATTIQVGGGGGGFNPAGASPQPAGG